MTRLAPACRASSRCSPSRSAPRRSTGCRENELVDRHRPRPPGALRGHRLQRHAAPARSPTRSGMLAVVALARRAVPARRARDAHRRPDALARASSARRFAHVARSRSRSRTCSRTTSRRWPTRARRRATSRPTRSARAGTSSAPPTTTIDYTVVSANGIWYVQVGALVARPRRRPRARARPRADAVQGPAQRHQLAVLDACGDGRASRRSGLWLLSAANADPARPRRPLAGRPALRPAGARRRRLDLGQCDPRPPARRDGEPPAPSRPPTLVAEQPVVASASGVTARRKPMRCTPSRSSRTTWALCSSPSPWAGCRRPSTACAARSRGPVRKRMRPARRCSARNALRALGRVARRVDGEGDGRDVVAEAVERAADLLRGERAGVLARRVEEGDDGGLALEVASVTVAPSWSARRKSAGGMPGGRRAPSGTLRAGGLARRRRATATAAAATANVATRTMARRTRNGHAQTRVRASLHFLKHEKADRLSGVFSPVSPSGAEFIRQIKSQIDRGRPLGRSTSVAGQRRRDRRRPRDRGGRARARSRAPCHVPRGHLESRIEGAAPDRSQRVILYCASGNRSALAAKTLTEDLGYESVESMTGGYTLWKDRGYEVEVPRVVHARAAPALLAPLPAARDRRGGPAEAARRQGAAARRRRARLADRALPRGGRRRHARHRRRRRRRRLEPPAPGHPHDRPRRRAEGRQRRGRRSTRSTPTSNVVKYQTRMDRTNIAEIIEGYDVIVDGLDNFPTRYLLNDASVRFQDPRRQRVDPRLRRPARRSSRPYDGPCYRCLYPVPPPAELAPSCGANGVLGVLPGTMGLLQATEVVKLVVGDRRAAHRPAAALRGPRRDVHRAEGPPRPRLPDLLARARRDHRRGARRLPGLRGVLRRRGLASVAPMATVKIPPVLRPSTSGEKEIDAAGRRTSAPSSTRSPTSTPPPRGSSSATTATSTATSTSTSTTRTSASSRASTPRSASATRS